MIILFKKYCLYKKVVHYVLYNDCISSFQVYDSNKIVLYRNVSSAEPSFLVTSLRPGINFLLVTYAANSRGRSAHEELETHTLRVAEQRTGILTNSKFNYSRINIYLFSYKFRYLIYFSQSQVWMKHIIKLYAS